MSLVSKIQALISAANAKTGQSDADLTSAVQRLCDGFGAGGIGTKLTTATISGGVLSFTMEQAAFEAVSFFAAKIVSTGDCYAAIRDGAYDAYSTNAWRAHNVTSQGVSVTTACQAVSGSPVSFEWHIDDALTHEGSSAEIYYFRGGVLL